MNERRGRLVEDFLRLDLHIPIEHVPIENHGQLMSGTLQDLSIRLEEKQQTAENIYEVLSAAVYGYKKAIVNKLRKKLALNVYLSLHVNFHLSTDPTFATDPRLYSIQNQYKY